MKAIFCTHLTPTATLPAAKRVISLNLEHSVRHAMLLARDAMQMAMLSVLNALQGTLTTRKPENASAIALKDSSFRFLEQTSVFLSALSTHTQTNPPVSAMNAPLTVIHATRLSALSAQENSFFMKGKENF
jgi:cyanophycinase-like exopeptidase